MPVAEQPTQIPVAARRFGEQQQAVARGGGTLRARGGGRSRARAQDLELRADERAQTRRGGGLVEARRAVEPAAIGERQCVVAELRGALRQLLGIRGRLEEREGAATAQLDVVLAGVGGHRPSFAFISFYRQAASAVRSRSGGGFS
jgi:hypothetical protein